MLVNLNPDDLIKVQSSDFNFAQEYERLRHLNANNGAVVTFVGLVRDFSQDQHVRGLFLEHYPAMTEKALADIVKAAKSRWDLGSVTLIHRIGQLDVNEQIVFVGVSSAHRKAAFAAAEYIMDYLKVAAPFWKKEMTDTGEQWVEMKLSDKEAAKRW